MKPSCNSCGIVFYGEIMNEKPHYDGLLAFCSICFSRPEQRKKLFIKRSPKKPKTVLLPHECTVCKIDLRMQKVYWSHGKKICSECKKIIYNNIDNVKVLN